ncbi:hypothetical protein J4N45_10325 [Vibrio sp. SCSIO 43140]|uniref:hypothetical protein n=1 Tax=Vibrio sp. SCSIO 43140 TaxID=2819100 RepID=UPI002075DDFF|nr:hypothetical protein [Vibrio sp. SCSIO 43140]USD58925.1 hypothetical protein J4N45_10325 [Vibrio sp. SCSIO 43140]
MDLNEPVESVESADSSNFEPPYVMTKEEALMAQVDVSKLVSVDLDAIEMFNKMIEHLGIELASLQDEAKELWKIVERICQQYYNEPHLAFNKKIQEKNVREERYRYADTGHLVVKVKVDTKIGPNRPDDMCLGLFIKDYGRTFKGTFKRMNWVADADKAQMKTQHSVLPKYPASLSSNNPPVRVACQPFCWEAIKKHGEDWEGDMFKELARRVHPVLRRYFYLIDTYQRLLDERTSLYRDLAVDLGIMPRKGNGKTTYKQLIPIFEKYYPEINIHNVDLSGKLMHQKSKKENKESEGDIYG